MKTGRYLGIDSSAYTTSLAVVDTEGKVLCDLRRPLAVGQGERGLRQSDALFLHVRHYPELFREASPYIMDGVDGVGVAAFPRRLEGSYMPVFLAGLAVATAASETGGVPLVRFSHQEGHIAAALSGLEVNLRETLSRRGKGYVAVHISGGTTDILHVLPQEDSPPFSVTQLGTSRDIHAGQLVDRVGVAMGLPFPAGPDLDRLAAQWAEKPPAFPASVHGMDMSLSGPESAALRALQRGMEHSAVAAGVFRALANSLEKALRQALLETGCQDVVLCGGVAANSHVRRRLAERLGRVGLHFSPPHLASDNGVGIALLAAAELC